MRKYTLIYFFSDLVIYTGPARPVLFDHDSSASPIPARIDTTMLQEAARKVLANIPSSVAAGKL